MDFVNFSEICRSCGVDKSNFFKFMAGADGRLSIKKCDAIYRKLLEVKENIA